MTDVTATTTLSSNKSTGMTDFTGHCFFFSRSCYPRFDIKPADQIIRLNIHKVLYLNIFHPLGLPISISYSISNGAEGIVTVQNNSNIDLIAKKPL